jgi:hypothetical protein
MRYLNIIAVTAAGILLSTISIAAATPEGRGFPSADAAAKALIDAAKSDDVTALIDILGPASQEILTTSDAVADQQIRKNFAARASAKMKLVPNTHVPKAKTLVVGKEEWPLPIPIVQLDGKWYFDVEQGKQEILARRIGGNELDAIEVCRGYVEARQLAREAGRAVLGQ